MKTLMTLPITCLQMKLKYDHNDLEDVMSYNEILDYVEREHNKKDGHH
jgi:hypothetical protein